MMKVTDLRKKVGEKVRMRLKGKQERNKSQKGWDEVGSEEILKKKKKKEAAAKYNMWGKR